MLLKNDGVLPLGGDADRRGRRVRPYSALPGRRELAGQPDPGRHPARRAAVRPTATCPSPAGYGIGDDGAGRRALLTKAERSLARPATVVVRHRAARRRRVRGLRPDAPQPARQPARHPRRPCAAANPNVVVVLVNGSTVVLGESHRTPGAPRGMARRPGRRRRDRGRADRAVNPSGSSPRPSRTGSRTTPRTSTSPATRRSCATARACSSATAATTRPTGRRVSVRVRPDLHDLRVVGAVGRDRGSVADNALGATVSRHGDERRRSGRAPRWYRCTWPTSSRASPEAGPRAQGLQQGRPGGRGVPRGVSRAGPAGVLVLVVHHGRWAVEAGDFALAVGTHSRDLPCPRRCRQGAAVARPLTAGLDLQEWMADKPAPPADRGRRGRTAAPAAVLEDELMSVIGTMPMTPWPTSTGSPRPPHPGPHQRPVAAGVAPTRS